MGCCLTSASYAATRTGNWSSSTVILSISSHFLGATCSSIGPASLSCIFMFLNVIYIIQCNPIHNILNLYSILYHVLPSTIYILYYMYYHLLICFREYSYNQSINAKLILLLIIRYQMGAISLFYLICMAWEFSKHTLFLFSTSLFGYLVYFSE